MDLVTSDLEQIRENYLIHSATKMNFPLQSYQTTDCLHAIFRRHNYILFLRENRRALQMVFWLCQACQRGALLLRSVPRCGVLSEVCPTVSLLDLNHACFRKTIVKEFPSIIFLFDSRRIVNGCKPRISTPFNAFFSCDVSFFIEIFNTQDGQGNLPFLSLKMVHLS